MGNHQHCTKVYNSTNDTLKIEIESPGNRLEKHIFEIPSGEHVSQRTKQGEVKIGLYTQNLHGEWNRQHVAKTINPSDVNLIIKKKRKVYSFVRSKYGNIYAESESGGSIS